MECYDLRTDTDVIEAGCLFESLGDILPMQRHFPGSLRDICCDHVESCRFPCAVRAEKTEDLPFLHTECRSLDCMHAVWVDFMEVLCLR